MVRSITGTVALYVPWVWDDDVPFYLLDGFPEMLALSVLSIPTLLARCAQFWPPTLKRATDEESGMFRWRLCCLVRYPVGGDARSDLSIVLCNIYSLSIGVFVEAVERKICAMVNSTHFLYLLQAALARHVEAQNRADTGSDLAARLSLLSMLA